MEENDVVPLILESCARCIYFMIHSHLIIEADKSATNKVENYESLIMNYAISFDNSESTSQSIADIYKFHKESRPDSLLTGRDFVLMFANRYTFKEHIDQDRFPDKVAKVGKILSKAIIQYLQLLKTKDESLYFGTDLQKDERLKLKEKIKKCIRESGVIAQYSIFAKHGQVVSLELYHRLLKKAKKAGVEIL